MTGCTQAAAVVWCQRTFKFEPVARRTQEDSGAGGLAGAGDNRRGTRLFQEFAVPLDWTWDLGTKGHTN
jgi:hypothetical protein